MSNPTAKNQDPTLTAILGEAQQYAKTARPMLAVFDLDSTLFDLTLRISKIIDAFAADPKHAKTYPAQCEILKKVEVRNTDWGIGEALTRAGLLQKEHVQFYKDIHSFWTECFFSNDFLHHDEPLPGAVQYVNALRKNGAHIMYLTGRWEREMLSGTERSLTQRGFPLGAPNIQLVLKPDANLDDAEFKRDILRDIEPHFGKIWLFENEPVNLNLIARDCPKIGLVFIISTHSGRESLEPAIARIPHFEVDADSF